MQGGKSQIIFDYQIQAKILELIEAAKEELWIVSPYIKLWERLRKILEEAILRNIPISIVTLEVDEKTKNTLVLPQFKDIIYTMFCIENLHAKVYLNERMAILTSMNLYEKSARINFEFGYLTTKEDEIKILKERINRMAKNYNSSYIISSELTNDTEPEVLENYKNLTEIVESEPEVIKDWFPTEDTKFQISPTRGRDAGVCPKCGAQLRWRKAKKTRELYRGCTNYKGGCRWNDRSY